MRILRQKEGMTLVELVVGMLLLAIVTTAVCVILSPMLKTQTRANELAECNALLDNIASQIIDDLLYSTDTPEKLGEDGEIWLTVNGSNDVKYAVSGGGISGEAVSKSGILTKNGVPVLPVQFYKGWRTQFVCEEISGQDAAYMLTVVLKDEYGEVVSKDYAVRPIVLNQYGDD